MSYEGDRRLKLTRFAADLMDDKNQGLSESNMIYNYELLEEIFFGEYKRPQNAPINGMYDITIKRATDKCKNNLKRFERWKRLAEHIDELQMDKDEDYIMDGYHISRDDIKDAIKTHPMLLMKSNWKDDKEFVIAAAQSGYPMGFINIPDNWLMDKDVVEAAISGIEARRKFDVVYKSSEKKDERTREATDKALDLYRRQLEYIEGQKTESYDSKTNSTDESLLQGLEVIRVTGADEMTQAAMIEGFSLDEAKLICLPNMKSKAAQARIISSLKDDVKKMELLPTLSGDWEEVFDGEFRYDAITAKTMVADSVKSPVLQEKARIIVRREKRTIEEFEHLNVSDSQLDTKPDSHSEGPEM